MLRHHTLNVLCKQKETNLNSIIMKIINTQIAIVTITLLSLYSYTEDKSKTVKEDFKIEMVKPIIKQNSELWNKGLKTKDLSVFLNLYDENGHYLPDADNAVHGNTAIAEYWKNTAHFNYFYNLL